MIAATNVSNASPGLIFALNDGSPKKCWRTGKARTPFRAAITRDERGGEGTRRPIAASLLCVIVSKVPIDGFGFIVLKRSLVTSLALAMHLDRQISA
jgi:hypothetical protein